MMKEWQTARKHVNNLKKTNPKAADKLNKNILEVCAYLLSLFSYFALSESTGRTLKVQKA